MQEKNTYELVFVTQGNGRGKISVPYGDPSCSDAEVAEVMNRIVASNVVVLDGGLLTGLDRAELITVTATELENIY